MRCLHPVSVPDKAHGGYRLVSCGHCAACLDSRAKLWSKRIKVEASHHSYVFFVTLTYSDEFVPIFRPEEVLDYQFCTDKQRIDLLDYLSQNDASEEYLVLRYKDIQNFMKRLRAYISNDSKVHPSQRQLRFFVCGEYGETTFRPHYHLLLFVDSEYLSTSKRGRCPLEKYVRKAWSVPLSDKAFRKPIGRISFELSKGACGNYCAGYVTSFSYIPQLLRQSCFKPFCMASRAPSLGSFKFDVQQAKEVLLTGSDKLFNKFGTEYDGNLTIPLWKSIKDNIVPKCLRYSELDNYARLSLYGIARFPYIGASFSEFYKYLYTNRDSGYFGCVLSIFGFDDVNVLPLPCDILDLESHTLLRSLYRQWCISNSVLVNCSLFDMPFPDYVSNIIRYYDDVQFSYLRSQLEFEEAFCKEFSSQYLLSYIDTCVMELPENERNTILRGFGLTTDQEIPDYRSLPLFVNKYSKLIDKIQVGKYKKRISDYVMHFGVKSNLNVL